MFNHFPPPPPYYKEFAAGPGARPPPALPPSKFTVFGREQDPVRSDDSISSSEALQRAAREDLRPWLHQLTDAILSKYIALLENASDATMRFNLCEEIQRLFLEAHSLVNQYRPLQALDQIRVFLEQQIAEKKEFLSTSRAKLEAIHQLLNLSQPSEKPSEAGPAATATSIQ